MKNDEAQMSITSTKPGVQRGAAHPQINPVHPGGGGDTTLKCASYDRTLSHKSDPKRGNYVGFSKPISNP